MKFLKTLLAFLSATLVSAAAFPQGGDATIEADFTGVRTKKSADGRQFTLSIFEGGKLDSTIVVIDNPSAPELTFNTFDASGAQVDGGSLDAAGAATSADFSNAPLCSRACIILRFIRTHGRRALKFIACLGDRIPGSCWISVLGCMLGLNPWVCFERLFCGAGPIGSCIRN